MPKKSLNNPNKPAVKTRKVVDKLGQSVTLQTKREGGKNVTYFDLNGKPALDKSGKEKGAVWTLKDKNERETKKTVRNLKTPIGTYTNDLPKTDKKRVSKFQAKQAKKK